MSIPTEIKTNAIKLQAPGAYVVLLEVRLNDSQKVYLTTNNEVVTFDGNDYLPYPVEVPGDEQEASGNPGEIEITIDNSSGAFDAFLSQNNGLAGRTVVVYEGFTNLVGTPSAWKRRELEITSATVSDQGASFTLGSTPLFDIQIPSVRFEREGPCTNVYTGKRCRYAGQTAAITSASAATPIVITTGAPHGFVTGATVTITGNTAANGSHVLTVIDATSFSLNGSTGTFLVSGGSAFVFLPICDLTRFGPMGCVAHDNILNYRGAPGIQRER